MSYDEGEHVKEVFAHFGLAYYLSGVFETGLAIALLTLDFLTKQKAELQRVGKKDFNRSKFEAEFDAFLDSQHAKTLGNLIKRIRELTDANDALKALLTTTKGRRDFLAHHFFRERAEDFGRRNGRNRMLAELKEAQELFEAADRQLTAHMHPILTGLGMPVDVIEAHIREYIRSVKDEGEEAQP